ncbi:radical SAM protein [Thermanaerothrix sp. 4228-RoL]|uniref:Radical SAM protein n=1 Tax=Thermanaerothrix solaris TaxID=3058434 RepID=A0ABU3NL20_9CHLR|nr:radical SAM protein [Thermanaerothrix sp. 4228-RoL]MDT8897538.1 radical SAM protein [Thermanaerothrix sp. 4228-RoL]
MVILGTWRGYKLTFSFKSSGLTVSFEQTGQTTVYGYDCAGRLWTGLENGISFRRGLDGKVVAKWRQPGNQAARRWLSPTEAEGWINRAHQQMRTLFTAIENGEAHLERLLSEDEIEMVRTAAGFDPQRAAADAAQYFHVYKPIGILPPDQYMAVVLQATEGCSFNTCTFCNFYRDRPFRIKTPDAFQNHILAVKAFLGPGLSLRRTIFLGDANALVVPMPRLVPLFLSVHEHFDVEALGGIYAFLDGFSGEKKSPADFAQLAALGLKRVYIGMESGNAELLRFLQKPGEPEDVIRTVEALKSAGVAVGIIILLGAGGHTFALQHVEDTIQALNSMPLDMEDIIYFSELIESEGMPYVQHAYEAGLHPLSPEERLMQGQEIEERLVFSEERGTPHISRYDIREFVY